MRDITYTKSLWTHVAAVTQWHEVFHLNVFEPAFATIVKLWHINYLCLCMFCVTIVPQCLLENIILNVVFFKWNEHLRYFLKNCAFAMLISYIYIFFISSHPHSHLPWRPLNLNVSFQRQFLLPTLLFTQQMKDLYVPENIVCELLHSGKNFRGIRKYRKME